MTGIFFQMVCTQFFERRQRSSSGCLSLKNSAGLRFWAIVLFSTMSILHAMPPISYAGLALMETYSFMQQLEPEHLSPAHMATISPDGRYLYAASHDSLAVFHRDTATGVIRFMEIETEARSECRYQVMSPDGANLYVAGYSVIEIFSREKDTGQLRSVDVIKKETVEMASIHAIQSMAISPDGNNLYVYAMLDEGEPAVAVFARYAASGRLRFLSVQKNGVNGVEGLSDHFEPHVHAITVSPDGRNAYVTGESDHAITVFSRDAVSGNLTFMESHKNGINGVEGLQGVQCLTISPDGRNVYTGARYGDESGNIAVFSREPSSGALRFTEVQKNGINGVDGLFNIRCLAISLDGGNLYAGVDGFTRNRDIQDYELPAVVVFDRDREAGLLRCREVRKNLAYGVEGLIGIDSLTLSPDDKHLYVLGDDQRGERMSSFDRATGEISVFNRDESSGVLTFKQLITEKSRLEGMRFLAMSPDGKNLYSGGPGDDELSVLGRDVSTGTLSYLETQKNGFRGVDGLSHVELMAMSPDGRNLYVSGVGSIAVFNVDITTGALTFREMQKMGIEDVAGIGSIRSIIIPPDGRNLYAAGIEINTIAIFSRNGTTGALTFKGKHTIDAEGLEDWNRVTAMTVSPDALNLYAACDSGASIAVFSRDMITGTLRLMELQKNALRGGPHDYATAVTISPDGRYLYGAGAIDSYKQNAVSVFSRNAMNGKLEFIEVYQATTPPIHVWSIAASPDGRFLFVGGWWAPSFTAGSYAIAVFSRNVETGKLTRIDALIDTDISGEERFNSLSIAVSPDSRNLYAGGAVSVFGFGWDADNDGIVDARDAFPLDPSRPLDTDHDGIADDGDEDDDGDGFADDDDAFPLDPAEWIDSDQDGAGDNADQDDDGDDVPDVVENTAHKGGDGNGDNIPDSAQPNVASLYTEDGAYAVTLESDPGTRLSHCEAVANPYPEEDAVAGIAFPCGLFSFTIDGTGVDPATIKLYLPTDVPVSTYYKYGRTPDLASDHWYEFLFDGETGARMENVAEVDHAEVNIITLQFIDANRGDDILSPDNRIIDLGGPAFRTEPGDSDDCPGCGGNGGCFITILRH